MIDEKDLIPDERSLLRKRRRADPLGQPEVETAILEVRWDIGIRSVIPETTAELMPEISRLAGEMFLLSTCLNDSPSFDDLSRWEACACLLEIDIPADIDIYAPRPSLSRWEFWSTEKADRLKRLKYFVNERARDQTQRQPGMPPEWIPKGHTLDGWMLFLDRLESAGRELSRIKSKTTALLNNVKKRAEIQQNATLGPDHRLPASSRGGRSQTVKRRFAYRLACVLAFPEWQKPALHFEAWTEGELAALFKKMGYNDLGKAKAVKELIRPYRRRIASRKGTRAIPSPSAYFSPRIKRGPK